MSGEISVEGTGETVGEAKWAAMRELERLLPGLDRAAVRFQVVSEGERGLLGVGYTPARVLASAARPPAPAGAPAAAEPSSETAQAQDALERIVSGIGASCAVAAAEHDDEIVLTLSGADVGLLIGRHGQTIDAIQYLVNAVARATGGEDRRRVVVDAAGYRARRAASLEGVARRSAERASATGQQVSLEPMTAVERRLVHEFLKDDPEVSTASEGTEPNRYVVVRPRHGV